MKVLYTTLIVICALVLAAHFFRLGIITLVIVSLVLPLLLLVRHELTCRLVQLYFALGTIEWLRVLVVYTRQRQSIGEPWIRLAVILGIVALITAVVSWQVGVIAKTQDKRSF
ncbi:MAG: hypothetical protein ISR91_00625 [Candidatus Delongbacteria bacterium]|nr:hypothetical protein [bacterium]MBL7032626.1 hypothetical protein [Candidatus Delongbacteria bacterium]